MYFPPHEDYDPKRMNRRWHSFRAGLAILLVLSLSLVLIHWHQETPGQDCGLCAAQQMPGIQSTTTNLLALPAIYGWRAVAQEPSLESNAFVPAHPGRAPPQSLSLIFV